MRRPMVERPPLTDETHTPWERFVETARRIMSVPKAEIDRREAAHQKRRRKRRRTA